MTKNQRTAKSNDESLAICAKYDQARANLFTSAAKDAQEGMGQCSYRLGGHDRCLRPTTREWYGSPMCEEHYAQKDAAQARKEARRSHPTLEEYFGDDPDFIKAIKGRK